jgi:hypothetical protein
MSQDGFDMYKELSAINSSYYKFYRVKNRGMMYVISGKITDQWKESMLNKYSNLIFYISQCQYAPEIKHAAILVCDKAVDYRKNK